MKVNVQREVTEQIDVELPYYYEHGLDNSTIYGRITETEVTTVHEHTENKFELEVEKHSMPDTSHACYFKLGYSSRAIEFEAALARCRKFIGSIL